MTKTIQQIIKCMNKWDALIFQFTPTSELRKLSCNCIQRKVYLFNGKDFVWGGHPAGWCEKHRKEARRAMEKQHKFSKDSRVMSLKKAREAQKKKRLKEKKEEEKEVNG